MRDKPVGGKTKNPGSPLAAYQRDKRSKTYGPTGGAQPTPSGRRAANTGKPKVNPGSPTAAAERALRVRPKKKVTKPNPGSPTAAAERQTRSRAAGSPTAAAERAGSRGRTAANTGRPKVNPGSPTAAAERQTRSRANAGSPTAAYERNKRSKTYGPTGGAQPKANPGSPSDAAARSRSKPKTDAQLIAEHRKLQAKLKGVDYNALGRYMEAKNYKGKGWNTRAFK
jgi:hypothetical protein